MFIYTYSLLAIPHWLFPINPLSSALAFVWLKAFRQCHSLGLVPKIGSTDRQADVRGPLGKPAYSNRKFDIIDPNKRLILYLFR